MLTRTLTQVPATGDRLNVIAEPTTDFPPSTWHDTVRTTMLRISQLGARPVFKGNPDAERWEYRLTFTPETREVLQRSTVKFDVGRL